MFAGVCDYCGFFQLTCRWIEDLQFPEDRVMCGVCWDEVEKTEGQKRYRKARTDRQPR